MFLNSPLSFVNPMFTNISLKNSRDCRHYKVLEENEKEIIIWLTETGPTSSWTWSRKIIWYFRAESFYPGSPIWKMHHHFYQTGNWIYILIPSWKLQTAPVNSYNLISSPLRLQTKETVFISLYSLTGLRSNNTRSASSFDECPLVQSEPSASVVWSL